LDPRRYFAGAALAAAGANAAILIVSPDSAATPLLRFVTGMCMAGIYPVGMKLAATWAKGDLGLVVGILVGALTVGSASPHLFNAVGGIDWRFTLALTSLAALAAAGLILLAGIGPNTAPRRPFEPAAVLAAWRSPALRLANIGYLGHMWELYAMWAWLAVFLQASFALSMDAADAALWAKLATFAAIAAGAAGCIGGGLVADRVGRTRLTAGAMAVSGACCLLAGLLYGSEPLWLVALCIVWGVAIVGDSAQFSASVAELSPPHLVGTMLTVQTCAGFLLTLVTIHLMPVLAGAAGWPLALATLALGPAVGIWAMLALRRRPEAARIAGGKG
ncbi:MAG: MFS transporter, partial [Acetobacterales bacterium]